MNVKVLPTDDLPLTDKKFKVYLRFILINLGNMDLMEWKYDADIFLQAKWREPKLDSKKNAIEGIDLSKFWNPELFISNLMKAKVNNSWHDVQYEDEKAFIIEKRRIKGEFFNRFYLRGFPFVSQMMNIHVCSKVEKSSVLLQDTREISAISPGSLIHNRQWLVFDFIRFAPRQGMLEADLCNFEQFPGLTISFAVARRDKEFFASLFFIMIVLSSIALMGFATDISEIDKRLTLGVILFLVSLTFKSAFALNMRDVPNFTPIDKLLLIQLTFYGLTNGWHAILSTIDDQNTAENADSWAFIAFCILFGVYNGVFLLNLIVLAMISHRLIKKCKVYYEKMVIPKLGQGWFEDRKKIRKDVQSMKCCQSVNKNMSSELINQEPDLSFIYKRI